jgi:predicted lysophospholipase L1 biosynthesis ABC-type transport system permease subunit
MFGAFAMLIASVGLFGLMSYSVGRRTNEIGIRMALGARGQDVVTLVMGESMKLIMIGVAMGVLTALAAGRLITALLFGVPATDAPTILGAVTLMLLVSAIAGYLPARRASRVDPLVALRYQRSPVASDPRTTTSAGGMRPVAAERTGGGWCECFRAHVERRVGNIRRRIDPVGKPN